MPLFIKNIAMKAVFDAVGESVACLCLSNLGNVEMPEGMDEHVERCDFVLGPQARAPYNCGVASTHGTLVVNFIRNTVQPLLEEKFFTNLVKDGIHVQVESNDRRNPEA